MWLWIRTRISRQLLAIFLFAVMLPFLLFYRYWDLSYSSTLEDSFTVNTEQSMSQMILHLNSYFANIQQNLEYLSGDLTLLEQMSALNAGTYPVSNEEEFLHFRMIDQTVSSMALMNSKTYLQTAVFLQNGIVIRYTSRYLPRPTDPDPEELKAMIDDRVDTKYQFEFPTDNPGWFAVSRKIVDFKHGSVLGFARIMDDTGEIDGIFANWSENKALLYLLDDKRQVLFHEKDSSGIAATPQLWNSRAGSKDSGLQTIDGKKYLVVLQPLQYNGMSVGALIPYQEWTSRISALRRFTLLMAGLVLLVSGSIYSLFSLNLTRSIANLSFLQKKLRQGDLTVRHQTKRKDEIEQLGQSFNAMAEEIQTLLQQVLRSELLSKEAEVRMLQSQMDPHFLYNTLETINMMAIASKAPDISRMVTLMARFYRQMVKIQRSELFLPLAKEYETAQLYLQIQKIRMGDRLQFTGSIEDGLDQCPMIKLTLQPLIENAVLHGIGPKPEGGRIDIKAERIKLPGDAAVIAISVADDGIGMMPEALEELRRNLNDPASQHSIGIYNLHWRIRLHFGAPYGLTIDSENGRGTAVRIQYPIVTEEDEHEGTSG